MKTARPPKPASDADRLRAVVSLLSQGWTECEVVQFMGVCDRTFRRWKAQIRSREQEKGKAPR